MLGSQHPADEVLLAESEKQNQSKMDEGKLVDDSVVPAITGLININLFNLFRESE